MGNDKKKLQKPVFKIDKKKPRFITHSTFTSENSKEKGVKIRTQLIEYGQVFWMTRSVLVQSVHLHLVAILLLAMASGLSSSLIIEKCQSSNYYIQYYSPSPPQFCGGSVGGQERGQGNRIYVACFLLFWSWRLPDGHILSIKAS